MFDFNTARRIAVSSIGAIVLSAAATGLATAPARASAYVPSSIPAWQASVDRSIRNNMDDAVVGLDLRAASVAVHFAADGHFQGAEITRSSGDDAVDAAALRTAREVDYPALPADLRGQPHTVTMQLFYGPGADKMSSRVRRAQYARR